MKDTVPTWPPVVAHCAPHLLLEVWHVARVPISKTLSAVQYCSGVQVVHNKSPGLKVFPSAARCSGGSLIKTKLQQGGHKGTLPSSDVDISQEISIIHSQHDLAWWTLLLKFVRDSKDFQCIILNWSLRNDPSTVTRLGRPVPCETSQLLNIKKLPHCH